MGDCHYGTGNVYSSRRIEKVKNRLAALGIEPERLRVEWLSATDGKRFAEVVNEMVEQLQQRREGARSLVGVQADEGV